MPVSPENQILFENRRNEVRGLLKFPLTLPEIAKILGIHTDTVMNDVVRLHRQNPKLPNERGMKSYGERLAFYFNVHNNTVLGPNPEHITKTLTALEDSLEIAKSGAFFRGHMNGLHAAAKIEEARLAAPPHLVHVQRMVRLMFENEQVDAEEPAASFKTWLHSWARQDESHISSVEGYEDLARRIIAYAADDSASSKVQKLYADVVITESTAAAIETATAVLDDRHRLVIQLRFPSGASKAALLDEIAEKLGVSRERVRQIQDQALRKLRDYLIATHDISPVAILDSNVVQLRKELQELREKNAAFAALEAERDEYKEMLGLIERESSDSSKNGSLHKSVQELGLSVRAENVLDTQRIFFIWQLCEKSEAEALSWKSFGRKTLYELKDLLADLGLSFGMKIPAEVRHAQRK